jgi:hypothetical protein
MSVVVTPWPSRAPFYGPVDEFLTQVPSYFSAFHSYVCKWIRAISPFCLTLWSHGTGSAFDPAWRPDLARIFADRAFHDRVHAGRDYGALSAATLRDFFTESDHLTIPRSGAARAPVDVMRYRSLQGQSSFSKSQEVIFLSYAIDVLLSHCFARDDTIFHGEAAHAPLSALLALLPPSAPPLPVPRARLAFVDVGAGKGYFSVFMAAEMRVRSLSIEASLAHASHLKNRIGCLVSQKKVAPNALDLLGLCIGYVTTRTNVEAIHVNSLPYQEWLDAVDRVELQKPQVTRRHRKVGKPPDPPILREPDLLEGIKAGTKGTNRV